jgi:alanyl-tRNA synthetase
MIMHVGEVVSGTPSVGDLVIARVDALRRLDIMRNHTATHLLHNELHAVLGDHARQAGSLVAPDRLRFDFTHPEALSIKQIERIEAGVNRNILGDYYLSIAFKPLSKAIEQGAIALFGEKYSETVRNITIGEPEPFSNELCGGTHVESTGDIGLFIITSEGSAAAGIRRIEAVTGRGAYDLVQRRFQALKRAASILDTSPEEVPHKTQVVLEESGSARKQLSKLRGELAITEFINQLDDVPLIAGVPVLTAKLSDADVEALRNLADRFRGRHSSGIAVLASIQNERPIIIATITDDLVKRGLHAGELVKFVASPLGGGGGGRHGRRVGRDPPGRHLR